MPKIPSIGCGGQPIEIKRVKTHQAQLYPTVIKANSLHKISRGTRE